MQFRDYETEGYYDELFAGPDQPRPFCRPLIDKISTMAEGELHQRQQQARASLYKTGITFTVYSGDEGTERIWPFDLIPRIVQAEDWNRIEWGLKQRIQALNCFLNDIYGEAKILSDGVIPEEMIHQAGSYRRECVGLIPPREIWCHITGSDLVRDNSGEFFVLEDNLRCPSGVSYVLENRQILKRTFPNVFEVSNIRPVDDYPNRLLETLEYLAPQTADEPNVVVLTPGIYNSAYYEHSFLARQMGVPLVEGQDLVVFDGFVHMRTTAGFERVDVIYRRIDDDFLDPKTFRPDSALGVPGIMEVFRNHRVALANAPGTGIADDKAIYTYVPDMIKYYLGEQQMLPNVETFVCWEKSQRQHVLENLDKLVVKAVNESGGYGMLVGPHSTRQQREEFAAKIKHAPRNYIAQPTLSLSRVPTIVDDHFEGRHVDLRPYILFGQDIYVLPGGLTRVALKKGSLVVNSSQGGGSKDTWVISDEPPFAGPGLEQIKQRMGGQA
ncbi:MAG: circularly permuted type 2 ATP-grasp protein [Phycisphaerae bacterium]